VTERFLLIDKYGVFLGKHSERLRLTQNKQVLAEVPLLDLEHVMVLSGGVALSTDALRACAERGIPVTFLSRSGQVYARLLSAEMGGTVKTRREQLLAYSDHRGVYLARAFATGKMKNQSSLLKYMAKYRKARDQDAFQTAHQAASAIDTLVEELQQLEGPTVDHLRPLVLSLEGRAAEHYWNAVQRLLPSDVAFSGRETRGAQDLVNMALNYGYGVLYSQVEQAILLAGLDPYAGFIHVDRAGKPSLVLDLTEEFRQPMVDRTVFALLDKGPRPELDQEGNLTEATRRLLAQRVLERLGGLVDYQGKKHRLRTVIQSQAHHLATYLRGEGNYKPFLMRW